MRTSWILAALLLGGCATEQTVGGGNPRTLAPLLGGGRAVEVAKAEPASEPVEDYSADLGVLKQAWPAVQSELPRLLRALIARGSWKDIHHSVGTEGAMLRVRHRPAVIAEVRKLVEALLGRLLRPLHVQVAFVESEATAAKAIFPPGKKGGARRFDAKAFRAAVAHKQARDLTRVAFTSFNGQWKSSERTKKHTLLSGVTVSGGVVIPRMTTLTSGASLQAAAWRWGEERAVVALSASFTGAARGGMTVRQQLHRELPRLKTTERRWQAHDLELSLPVRELMEYSGKLTLARGEWTVAGIAPRDAGRLCAVVVKVDWVANRAQPVRISPQSADKNFVLQLIPVALPSESQKPPRIADQVDFRNRQSMQQQADSFQRRARTKQQAQKKNTFNFQSVAGALTLSAAEETQASANYRTVFRKTESYKVRQSQQALRPGSQSVLGAMPPHLEKLKAEVMKERWPEGTALEFAANHVFAVHREPVLTKVRELLGETHAWRNQRVATRVHFTHISSKGADDLSDAYLSPKAADKLLRAGKSQPTASLLGRGGSRNELFVAEMHSVLAGAWSANSSSPAMQVYFKGVRLAALPRLGPEVGRTLSLYVKRFELANTAAQRVAGAVLQQVRDGEWTHERELHLRAKGALLTGMRRDAGEAITGLLVATQTTP